MFSKSIIDDTFIEILAPEVIADMGFSGINSKEALLVIDTGKAVSITDFENKSIFNNVLMLFSLNQIKPPKFNPF